MKKNIFIALVLVSNYILSQVNSTLSGNVPLVFTSLGTGSYDITAIYHDNSNGMLIDLARNGNNFSSIPIDFKIDARGGGKNFFTIKGNTGNVGIGTSLPNARLDVNNNIRISPFTIAPNVGYSNQGSILSILNGNIYDTKLESKIAFGGMYNPSGTQPHEAIYNYISWSTGDLSIKNNQQTKLLIGGGDEWGRQNVIINPTGGNVGIGTSNPSQKLEVNGFLKVNIPGFPHSTILLGNDANDNIIADNTPNKYYGGGYFFRVHNNSISNQYIDAMMLTESGKVGIGTFNPKSALDVVGDIGLSNYSPLIYLKRNTNDGGYIQGIQTQLSDGTNNWFFGNLQGDSWIVAKGDYNNQKFMIKDNGNAALQGKFEAKEVKVTTTPTADFVFANNYLLPKLEDIEKFVIENKHLPEVASAKEMEKNGVNIGEFQIKLLQKIEELTLYAIEQNKQILKLNEQLNSQLEKIKQLQNQVVEINKTKIK